jgi:N5-(cytidine 5'-diphosphoramidyl)-L-glutamine hydrolase
MVRRVGITMRVDNAVGYDEPRDCLAQEWWNYLLTDFPHIQWLALPNLGGGILEYVKALDVDAFLLSGGNDLGNAPKRDATETAILEISVKQRMPVLGVCRGLQMMNRFFGGGLVDDLSELCGSSTAHVRKDHSVMITGGKFRDILKEQELLVNSYHRQAVTKATLASGLEAFAISQDGLIEGVHHRDFPMLAIQWHPERNNPAREADRILINNWLEWKGT